MKKLLVVLFVLALPSVSFAVEELLSGPDPTTPKSFLTSSDIFFTRAHACATASFTCGPDNVVSSPFAVLAQFRLPSSQSYTRIFNHHRPGGQRRGGPIVHRYAFRGGYHDHSESFLAAGGVIQVHRDHPRGRRSSHVQPVLRIPRGPMSSRVSRRGILLVSGFLPLPDTQRGRPRPSHNPI